MLLVLNHLSANRQRTEYVLVTPIPEKQQLIYNYTLFPKDVALSATKSWPAVHEPFLFSVPVTAPKAGVVSGYAAIHAGAAADSYPDLMDWAIASQLGTTGNATQIVKTNPQVFHSALRQPQRPNEKAVHVKAYRGSKDGFLFFLPTGILWGFKKPLLFMPLDRILSLSYTNILQRTFNIEIEIDVSHAPREAGARKPPQSGEDGDGDGSKTEVIEFSMIDQEDYQTIDDKYVRRHGLNNRSLAEGKRARRQLKENGVKGGDRGENGAAAGAGVGGGDPEDVALDRVEQMLEDDEEDEEEEDYDPGSEGESEGSGSSSEEESGEEGEEGDDDEEDEDGEGEEDEDGMDEQ